MMSLSGYSHQYKNGDETMQAKLMRLMQMVELTSYFTVQKMMNIHIDRYVLVSI